MTAKILSTAFSSLCLLFKLYKQYLLLKSGGPLTNIVFVRSKYAHFIFLLLYLGNNIM